MAPDEKSEGQWREFGQVCIQAWGEIPLLQGTIPVFALKGQDKKGICGMYWLEQGAWTISRDCFGTWSCSQIFVRVAKNWLSFSPRIKKILPFFPYKNVSYTLKHAHCYLAPSRLGFPNIFILLFSGATNFHTHAADFLLCHWTHFAE